MMKDYAKDYYEKIQQIQKKIIEEQSHTIKEVGKVFAETIKTGNLIYVFGASHAGILAEELFYRTGGLALINPLFNPSLMLNTRPVTLTSQMERLEGFGKTIIDSSKAKEGDVILIHSVSGRNPVSIDIAIRAKEKGIKVIVITNITYSKKVTSRHSCGNNLYELGDYVIDNHGDFEDSCISIDNLEQKIAPTSSVIGCMIVNMIVINTVSTLIEMGVTPPVFHSANVDGGDDFNDKLFEQYNDKINYM
jgi:uncharacterized phosphosugar-binding protein